MKVFMQYFIIWLNWFIGMHMFSLQLANKSGRPNFTPRIVNGYRCPIEEHPYLVSIRITRSFAHNCGGTILSEYWILTAGHCCLPYYRPGDYTVVFGLSIINENTTTAQNRALVLQNFVHHNPLENDVCLMLVDRPIKQRENVRFVQLSNYLHKDMKMEFVCKQAQAMGWGIQYPRMLDGTPLDGFVPPNDPHLQCVTLPIYERDECEELYGGHLPKSIICTYANGKDACQGDSGGPLMCDEVQYGISSFGIGCAFAGYPGAFTRVDTYEDFIRNVILKRSVDSGKTSSLYKTSQLLIILLCIVCWK